MARPAAPLDPDKYEPDEDGWTREIVGPWAADKYAYLARYVDISRNVRRDFIGPGSAGATYIELFSGPGRVRFKSSAHATHGSPLVAWEESARTNTRFTKVHMADLDTRLVDATAGRLAKAGAPVQHEAGPAGETLARILPKLDKFALHVAFLDPYNLDSLSFDLIRQLAGLKRMDILIHVSLQDLNRNLLRYLDRKTSPLDSFAPDWRAHVDGERSLAHVRGKLFEYWRSLVRGVDMSTAETAELVVGPNNQPLYWLAFVARHGRALEFWEKIRNLEPKKQDEMF